MNLSGISNETLLGRALRLPLRLIPRGARIPILQGPLRGMVWIAGAGNHGCWLGSYEQEKQNLFCRHVHRGDVVYDIGANAGFYTLLASKLTGDEGRVFSFEPLPHNVAYLRRHLALNRIGNCTMLECAVSARTGLAPFELGENSHVGRLTIQESNTIQVRTATLDQLAARGEITPPNVIKCDIEGGEFDALTGAREILAEYRPHIFLATHGPQVHRLCCDLLASLHYELESLDGRPIEQTSELIAFRR